MSSILVYFTAVDCGSLTVPNGKVSASSGTTFMNTATYTCDDGYNLNRATIRTCEASGNWSLTAPICDRECFNTTANLFSYICFISR